MGVRTSLRSERCGRRGWTKQATVLNSSNSKRISALERLEVASGNGFVEVTSCDAFNQTGCLKNWFRSNRNHGLRQVGVRFARQNMSKSVALVHHVENDRYF